MIRPSSQVRSGRAATFARWAAGIVLATAAILKLYALSTSTAADTLLARMPGGVVVGIAAFEGLLAAMLLSGLALRPVQQVTGITFAAFAGASAMFAVEGANCGCFGDLPVPSAFLAGFCGLLATWLFLTIPAPLLRLQQPKDAG